MKRKENDEVFIRSDLEVGKRYGGYYFTKQMEKYLGKKAIITNVYSNSYGLYIDDEFWFCTDEMLEDAPKQFTKADLESGMIVEYRDGRRRLVVNGDLMGETLHNILRNYNDDLTALHQNNLDIVKVYNYKLPKFSKVFDNNNLKLIWEREEPKKEPKKVTIELTEEQLDKVKEILK